MKVKLIENFGYHYGDLDKAVKADKREIMGGRGTGHFGTGFYLIGTFNPDKAFSYKQRACWEVDLSKYNLFKPRSNNEAYSLHDNLKTINSIINTDDLLKVDAIQLTNEIDDILEELSVDVEDLQSIYGVDYDTAFDMYIDGEYDINDIFPKDIIEKVKNKVEEFLAKYKIDRHYNFEYDFNQQRFGAIEEAVKDYCDDIESNIDKYNSAVLYLSLILGKSKDKIDELARKAIDSPNQEDSKSTVFMKSLGYEGIDVTHLNHDADGLSGLDNFSYGSVVYDLKPGTYRKIKDRE